MEVVVVLDPDGVVELATPVGIDGTVGVVVTVVELEGDAVVDCGRFVAVLYCVVLREGLVEDN
mgnify:FL=1